jgi:hypothetical protein
MQIYSSDYGAIEKCLYDKRIYNCTLCKNKNKTKQIKTKQKKSYLSTYKYNHVISRNIYDILLKLENNFVHTNLYLLFA